MTSFDRWLRRTGTTSYQFARKSKYSISAVQSWRQGKRLPRPAAIAKIKRLTKGRVKPADWYEGK